MMDIDTYIVAVYVLFWPIRINGSIRRGRQPLLRGKEWFFDVPVTPDFYTGAGRRLLLQYRLRMLIPFVVDIPLAAYIFLSGHLFYLNWLVLGLCALIHINHIYSVDLAERRARPYAAQDREQPTVIIGLSLTPRRLRDYSNRSTEWAVALSTAVGFAWLSGYYLAAPAQHNGPAVFGVPALCLYLQMGMFLIKSYIVRWRSPVPQTQAAEHIEVREKTRGYYLKMCDWVRIALASSILFRPMVLTASPAAAPRLLSGWLWTFLILSIAATIWIECKRKQLVGLALRARPVQMPDLQNESDLARWPLCYQRSVPIMILRGARGYSLNLANTLTFLSAAYLAGMVVLIAALRIIH